MMAIKLNMSKAYDRVEWSYLEEVMRRMRFMERWIKLMMVRIKKISYSILVNGEHKGMIHPTYGIKQGDPRSPFIFLLCMEGDNFLFCKANQLECEKVLNILEIYGNCSRQQINKRKTTIFFSKARFDTTRQLIKSALGVKKGENST